MNFDDGFQRRFGWGHLLFSLMPFEPFPRGMKIPGQANVCPPWNAFV
ncbi:hypothetical protein HNQ77_004392 [Silvibacterium bohemicum]|uniref:Uncharacterized protein n=1 Tax=Silvibacterium bohemicum TaxID=1577686 RepID=A0A841JZ52_9BACT|nr:hypothetical protein [Silvibacterium bohemicum]